ncbi:Heterokaryon incompatibility protein (HET) domain containing protein [Naviculisporaceae sp. PSN 640]
MSLNTTPSREIDPSLPDFNFDVLCNVWKETRRGKQQEYLSPSTCKRKCEGCSVITQAAQVMMEAWCIDLRNPDLISGSSQLYQVTDWFRSSPGVSFPAIVGSFVKVTFIISAPEGIPNPWNLQIGPPTILLRGFDPAINHVRSWLSKCLGEHSRCGAGPESRLPTRVLDVGSKMSDPIRLHEPRGEKSRYLCLSYCWGKAPFISTTRETLESRKQKIKYDDLPQTFRDFIQIARALGVRYVWIDALCIIQDDKADWAYESSRMADVYRLSYLCVAPAWADSPHRGCFPPPEQGLEVGPVIVTKRDHFPSPTHDRDTNRQLPLFSRAWVYQERILSPRTLYFSRHEMLWDCRDGRDCECGTVVHHHDDLSKLGFDDMTSEYYRHNHNFQGSMWRIIVCQYSGLQLTYVSDRLAALAGMAAEIHHASGQEYVVGLWRDTLLVDMCWFANSSEPAPRRIPHRAPSWSWASVDGAVCYPTFLVFPRLNETTLLASVVGIQLTSLCTFHVPDPRKGFVELHCLLLPARLESSGQANPPNKVSSFIDAYSRQSRAFC